jgi:hypothetical protein
VCSATAVALRWIFTREESDAHFGDAFR